MSEAARVTTRGRGRPRGARGTTKAAIERAASEEFAERGYDAASLRGIAARAGVDPSLVHYYFDGKADLFAAQLRAPFRPDTLVARVLAGPRDELGRAIVAQILSTMGSPAARRRGVSLLRNVIGNRVAGAVVKEFLVREVFLPIATALGTPDAALRANLAASQILGLMVTRYVLRLEPLATATADELVDRVGPVLQWHLVDYAPGTDISGATKA